MTEFEDYSCFGSTRSPLQPYMCELSWMPTTESILSSRLRSVPGSVPPCRLRPPVLSDHICLAHWVVVICRFYCTCYQYTVVGEYCILCVQIVWLLNGANQHESAWKPAFFTSSRSTSSSFWSGQCIKVVLTSTAMIRKYFLSQTDTIPKE